MHERKNAVFQGSDGVEFFRKFRVSCGLMVVFAVKPLPGHIYKKSSGK